MAELLNRPFNGSMFTLMLSSMAVTFEHGSTILFDRLSLPALHYLRYANATGPSLRRLNSLLARSAYTPRTLVLESTLETSISENEFLGFLQLVPSLVELSLQCGISAGMRSSHGPEVRKCTRILPSRKAQDPADLPSVWLQ